MACAWSCCLVRARSRPCLRELASKMRPSFVIMAWFYARPPCKQGRSHDGTVFGSLCAGISETGTTPAPSVPSRSPVRCVSLSLRKSGNKSNTPPSSTVAATGHAGRCNPSILIAAIMTWAQGKRTPTASGCPEPSTSRFMSPKRQRPGKPSVAFARRCLCPCLFGGHSAMPCRSRVFHLLLDRMTTGRLVAVGV